MTRRATAVLEVQVQDTQLDAHLKKLEDVRSAWTFLGNDLTNLGNLFSKGTGDELKKVSTAIAAMGNVKAGGGATSIIDALAKARPQLAGLDTELEKVSTTTNKLANDSVRWARALTKASAEVGRLEKHTDSLVTSQQRTSIHMKYFEDHLTLVTGKLRTQGKEMLDLIQAYAGFNKASKMAGSGGGGRSGGGSGGSVERGGIRGFWDGLKKFEQFFIRNATTMFISGQWIKHAAEDFRNAAAQIDLESVVGRSVDNFGAIMDKTRKSTKGMVSDLQILKSAAIMSSFKIPMESFADNMELVQKMAVRTGQDTTYMFDSLARGVSRLSPAILDNLGLQIKLKDAYAAWAAQAGVGVDTMDKQQQKLAVLAEVTSQMREATKEVDPAASLMARMDQMETTWTNFIQKVKGGVLQSLMLLASTEEERLAIITDRLKLLSIELEKYGRSVSDTTKDIKVAIGGMDQKEVDTTTFLLGGMLETDLAGIRTGYEESLESEGKLWRSKGKTREQVEAMKVAEEERLFVERNLLEVDKLLAAQKEHVLSLSQDIANVDKRHLDRRGRDTDAELASGQAYLTYLETLREGLNTGVHDVETFRENMEKLSKSVEGSSAQKTFVEQLRKQLADFENSALMQHVRKEPGGILGLMFVGAGGAAWITGELKKIEDSARKTALVQDALFKIAHAREIGQIDVLDAQAESRARELALLQGSTVQAYDLARAQDQMNAAAKELEKLKENSLVLGKGEQDATNAQIIAADQIAMIWQLVYETKFKINETEEYFQKYLEAGLFGARELKDLEFERLSGGRSRAELEVEMLKLGKLLLDVEQKRAAASKELTFQNVLTALMAGFQADALEKTIAKIQKIIGMAPKDLGGGGGKKDKKEKTPKQKFNDEYKYEPDDINRNLVEMVTSADGVTQLYIRQFKDSATGVFELTKSLVQDFKKESEVTGLFGLGTNFDVLIERNVEAAAAIDKIAEEYGIMTPEMQNLKNEILNANGPLERHRDLLLDIAKATNEWADANAWAWEGAKDLVGEDFIAGFTGLGDAIKDVSEKIQAATQGEATSYDLMLAGMSGIRAFSTAFMKDRRDRAKLEMYMNAGAAFAAAGLGNWPAAAAHAQAAVMYGLVGHGKVGLPTKATTGTKEAAEARKGGDMHFHLYADMVNTQAEKGQLLEQMWAEARAAGR